MRKLSYVVEEGGSGRRGREVRCRKREEEEGEREEGFKEGKKKASQSSKAYFHRV